MVPATVNATKQIEAEELAQGDSLTAKEKVQLVWKNYIPAVAVGTASAGCLIYAGTKSARKRAALATAAAFSNASLREYQGKVIETVGEESEKTIREAIVQDKIDRTPLPDKEIQVNYVGDELFFDPMSGRYFMSNDIAVQKIVNDLNFRMRSENYITLNEFYMEIPIGAIEIGDQIGWSIDRGYIDISTTGMKAENGKPCLALIFNNPPQYMY